MSTQINRASVMLESVGTVTVSHIFMPVDSFGHSATGRPLGGYHEVAVLFDDRTGQTHCYIVDSNIVDQPLADAIFESLSDASNLAELMLDLWNNPRGWDN